MLEFDLHLSADDQPVIIHDQTLGRTTDGRGRVRDRSLAELKRLDAGAWFGRQFRGQRLQSLAEILERFRGRVGFAIELKATSRYRGIEERVVSLLERYDAVRDALVMSFDHAALVTVGARHPGVRRVALIDERSANIAALVPSDTAAVGLSVRRISERQVIAGRAAGLDVYVWTVNTSTLMDRLIAWNVTGIITDTPDVLRARLGHVAR
jgi:glycerophosphoryl diester phosphodiesterase